MTNADTREHLIKFKLYDSVIWSSMSDFLLKSEVSEESRNVSLYTGD